MARFITTDELRLAYTDEGGERGATFVMLHGWPDSAESWDPIARVLVNAGHRVVRPHLRGHGETRFLDPGAAKSGQLVALAADISALLDELELTDVILVGHDWGARTSYAIGALFPERIKQLVAMSSAHSTGDLPQVERYSVASAYWYEWFLATAYGRRLFAEDRTEICRYLWRCWSPTWQFSEEEFAVAAAAWDNPDWFDVTLHAYLHRWYEMPGDPRHEPNERRFVDAPQVQRPTIMLHGELDPNRPVTSEGKEHLFPNGYDRRVLPGLGHFVPREAPGLIADILLEVAARPSTSSHNQ